ncbi:hypothetical protein [Streptomyces sp. NPDC050848]|uniref:hypothetical protein n=1 Tax=Streptomyces sp. NPDC050848 TaxID=3155791 RepID=UPI003407CD36
MLIDNVKVERIEGNAVGANVQPTGAVQLTWHFAAVESTPASYQLHRSTDADFRPSTKTLISEVPAAWTAEDGSARPGRTYTYKVVALAADGGKLATTDPEAVTMPSSFLDEQQTDVLTPRPRAARAPGWPGGSRPAPRARWRSTRAALRWPTASSTRPARSGRTRVKSPSAVSR